MDAAAASRRGKPNRGRPVVPPNYVSLRDLQELRLKEKEEQRRREEEEAAARRAREEQRKRQEEEEEAAARRFVEERRRREEEAAARRARDAAAAAPAPRPEMRASSSSHTSSFRNNERARGGQRVVVVADRPPPPPRGECAAVKIDGAGGGCRGKKGPDGGAANAPLAGGFKAQSVGKVSAGVVAGPAKAADVSSHAGKPEEKRKGEASGCQGTAPRNNTAPGELAKVDIASYRGPARPRHSRQGTKKGLDVRSTETAMTSSIGKVVEASPLPPVNLESKGNSRPGDRSSGTVLASIPGKAAEASPPRGVMSENKGKKKPLEGRQAAVAPSSDLQDRKKVEGSGCEGTASGVSSLPSEQAGADVTSYRMPLKPMYRRKGKKGFDSQSTETATTIVGSKGTDASPLVGVNLEIKGEKGLTEQDTEKSLARMPGKAANTSLAPGFKSENNGKKESSGGRHASMVPSTDWRDGMKTQPCLAAEGSGSQRSSGGQGTTWEAKPEGFQGKPAEQWWSRNSGRQLPGGYRRVNATGSQHAGVWVPKEVGKFP